VKVEGNESASATFRLPQDLPANVYQDSVALLLEPAKDDETGQKRGDVSDWMKLSVTRPQAGEAFSRARIEFGSDPSTSPSPPFGIGFETGDLQAVVDFRTLPRPGGPQIPVPLPPEFSLFAQSDIIPEPSTRLLFGSGIAGLLWKLRRVHADTVSASRGHG
jgi:hypothetical protein